MSSASATEIFGRLLEESIACLADPAQIQAPDDELHREILLPLLPAMLADEAIREHWRGQSATGFAARLAAHLEHGASAPSWQAGDFEIHVTASYLAGPDARALADTLLSEEPLREMTASLLNQMLAAVWPRLKLEAVVAAPIPEVLEPVDTVDTVQTSQIQATELPPVSRPRLRYSIARWGLKDWPARPPIKASK